MSRRVEHVHAAERIKRRLDDATGAGQRQRERKVRSGIDDDIRCHLHSHADVAATVVDRVDGAERAGPGKVRHRKRGRAGWCYKRRSRQQEGNQGTLHSKHSFL